MLDASVRALKKVITVLVSVEKKLAKCRDWQGRASAAEISEVGELVGTGHIRGRAVKGLLRAEWRGRVGTAKPQARQERERDPAGTWTL